MQESQCPECGSGIGGMSHALNSSNRVSNFAGGGRSAWDPDNYQTNLRAA